jgi:hypothetical protein
MGPQQAHIYPKFLQADIPDLLEQPAREAEVHELDGERLCTDLIFLC